MAFLSTCGRAHLQRQQHAAVIGVAEGGGKADVQLSGGEELAGQRDGLQALRTLNGATEIQPQLQASAFVGRDQARTNECSRCTPPQNTQTHTERKNPALFPPPRRVVSHDMHSYAAGTPAVHWYAAHAPG